MLIPCEFLYYFSQQKQILLTLFDLRVLALGPEYIVNKTEPAAFFPRMLSVAHSVTRSSKSTLIQMKIFVRMSSMVHSVMSLFKPTMIQMKIALICFILGDQIYIRTDWGWLQTKSTLTFMHNSTFNRKINEIFFCALLFRFRLHKGFPNSSNVPWKMLKHKTVSSQACF